MSKRIELHSSFMWDCDDCGRTNFQRAVHGDLSDPAFVNAGKGGRDVSAREIAVDWKAVGKTDSENQQYEYTDTRMHIVLAPKAVKCGSCGSVFRTSVPGLFSDGKDSSVHEEEDFGGWESEGQV